jgi:sulfofructose kinase
VCNMTERVRVVGVGEAALDHLGVVDRYPEQGTRQNVVALSIQGSGSVSTALAVLAQFGLDADFIGKVGDDAFGRFIRDSLKATGVNVKGMAVQADRMSPYNFIIAPEGRGRPTILHTAGDVAALSPNEVDLSIIDGANLLVLDGYQVDVQVAAAERANAAKVPVVLYATQVSEGMGELLALSNVLVASERFAAELAPRGESEDSLLELSKMGPETVVVTIGEEGSVGLQGQKLVRQPPLHVNVTDTIGAGNVFLGGFCYGLTQDWSLERSMLVATAAAGLSCKSLGARGGIPSLEEALALT